MKMTNVWRDGSRHVCLENAIKKFNPEYT